MEFTLLNAHAIRGDQLTDEIKKATGLDVRLAFVPPLTVEIYHPDAERLSKAIQSVISAHVPNAEYFPSERAAKAKNGNAAAIRKALEAAMADMDALMSATPSTVAHLIPIIQKLARNQKRMIRLLTDKLDAVE